ncbi:MAG: hypothetical protein JW709_13975, partial [Sedimentisphaerales bacterium]|nr:hypothetical protein [Sedimentisphaerales bacterium]
ALVSATPHIGASTEQASEAVADEVVRIVQAYMQTGSPLNTVNMQEKSTAPFSLIVRHFNRVGVLAGVLDELRNEGVNIEEMENIVFAGQKAANCSLKLDSEPSAALISRLEKGDNIIQIMLNPSN